MKKMKRLSLDCGARALVSASLTGVALCALGAAAHAATFVAPKMMQRAASSVPVAGAGTVIVQVLVNADGSFKVQKVISSTDARDDAAALDIAKHSSYKPATSAGAPTKAFYDFTLVFKGASGAGGGGSDVAGVFPYEQMVRAGKYSAAKSGLRGYLVKHPGDVRALTFLGVSDVFLGDNTGAVAAFDQVSVVPDAYKAIALKAYTDQVTALSNSKDYQGAEAAQKHVVAIQPGYPSYDNLAFLELSAGDYASAVSDFQTARTRAVSEHGTANERATIDANLATSYAKSGDLDKAKQIAAEAKQLDPAQNAGYAAVESVYAGQADDDMKVSKYADAATSYEQAAAVAPADSVTLYDNAAFALIQEKTTDSYTAAKADADKARAIDPANAGANFAEGVVLANEGKHDDAVTYLNKADASAKARSDASLSANIENVLKQLNSAPK
jgi:tetratricopeptide (TPR) repeat protein